MAAGSDDFLVVNPPAAAAAAAAVPSSPTSPVRLRRQDDSFGSHDDFGVFDDAKTYYSSDKRHRDRFQNRTRTFSQVHLPVALRVELVKLGAD